MPHVFPALDLGPLPAELVGRMLHCELIAGVVHFSAANQDHAFARHGEEFRRCLPHVEATIIAPDYIGQSPHHPVEFEMVRAMAGNSVFTLVAVTLGVDDVGRYSIQSVYPIGRGIVERRLRKRHLFRVETTKAPP